MINILFWKTKTKILNSPHLAVILTISLVLIFIYYVWPWRHWQLTYGPWQWFPWLTALYRVAIVEVNYHIVGVLFLIPIFYGVVFLWWRGALVAWLLSLGGVFPVIADMWSVELVIVNTSLLLLPILVVLIVDLEIRWHTRERSILREQEKARRVYLSEVLDAQENERRRIAQELHDETIQTLLVIASHADTLLSSEYDGMCEVRESAEQIRDTTLAAIEDLRRISLDLRPAILDNLGLVPALRWLVDLMNKESGIDTRILVNGVQRNLSAREEATIFRLVQEALNNIKHHSQAEGAMVTLEFNGPHLKIAIQDNGQGFRPPKNLNSLAAQGKLGLIGIQERIASLGGMFQIRSTLGKGTLISIELEH